MKTILLMVLVTIAWGFNPSESLMNSSKLDSAGSPVNNENFFLSPNPATTELNVEFLDQSLTDAVLIIHDMSGKKYLMIPVKGREQLSISLDRRFVRGDYTFTIVKGKNKFSKNFSVVD